MYNEKSSLRLIKVIVAVLTHNHRNKCDDSVYGEMFTLVSFIAAS